ncbi:MAG: PAS domain S-box protein [Bacteroidetes bacterium]|nr:PAS domain S-box protein [Bacteroidota bacterium]
MGNTANELFLLNTSLSQLRNAGQVIQLFIESIKTIFPNKILSWHPEKDNPPHPNFPVCSRNRTYGFIHFDKSMQKDQESYVLLQIAAQTLAVLLEKLSLEESLLIQKIHLQQLIDEKASENAALNEEYQAMNEELMEGNRNLLQINDQLALEIQERRKAEELQQATLQRLNTHISSIYAGVIAVSKENQVEIVNQAFCDLFNLPEPPAFYIGLASEEMIEKVLCAYADPADTLARMQKIIAEGHPVRGEELAMQDGRYCLVDFIPIIVNDRKCGHLWHHQDITNRKKTEEALRESNEYLENLFNYANAPIIVWDPQFHITRFNHAFEYLTGLKEAEVIGKSLEMLFPPELALQSMILIRKTLTGERWETVEIKIQHEDGSVKTVLWNSATLFGSDGKTPVATIAQGHDITKRKKAEEEINLKNEELQKINLEKDKFFSILAHDLRSPFSAFLGFTQLMAEELPTMTLDQIQKIAINMRKSATNLYNLLNNLLEWSRLQRGATSFKPESFMLLPSITECLESVKENAVKKGIEIITDIPEDLNIIADVNMMQTIIRNLVSNAVKYTNKGGKVEITVKVNTVGSLELCIKDSGIGMTKDMISHLFSLDQNINRQGTEGEPSTGLGLIICKEFVEKHGGKIRVVSEEGKGSIFCFTIPT